MKQQIQYRNDARGSEPVCRTGRPALRIMVVGLISVAGFFFLAIAWRGQPVGAQAATQELCRKRMVSEATFAVTEYRAHIFGSRRDRKNTFTALTGGEVNAEIKGIFETKERLASELVPALVEDYRTLRCKLLAVCRVVSDSIQFSGNLTVENLGCENQQLQAYPECRFATGPESATAGTHIDVAVMQGECQRLIADTLAAERAVLKTAVGYDSGYRSLLQFAGMMDWMLEDLSTKAIKPLQDMINLLGKLHQIPCFIAQCDAPEKSLVESN